MQCCEVLPSFPRAAGAIALVFVGGVSGIVLSGITRVGGISLLSAPLAVRDADFVVVLLLSAVVALLGAFLFASIRITGGSAPLAATHNDSDDKKPKSMVVLEEPIARLVSILPKKSRLDCGFHADNELMFSVNGEERRIVSPSPSLLLADYLRSEGLTGTKVGCGEGGCGACSVIAVGANGVPLSINACLKLLVTCDGLAITTVEGLGSQRTGLSAVQKAIVKGNGSQCGFCTPGWVTAMTALLAKHSKSGKPLTEHVIERALDGNLCRCTGYRPIVQSFKETFAEPQNSSNGDVGDIEACAGNCHDVRTKEPCGRLCESKALQASALSAVAAPTATIFRGNAHRALHFSSRSDGLDYCRPISLAQLQVLLAKRPDAVLVSANTGMGVAKYYSQKGPVHGIDALPKQQDALVVDVSNVAEMSAPPTLVSNCSSGGNSFSNNITTNMVVGASTTIIELIQALEDAQDSSTDKAPFVAAQGVARHLHRVAGTQVRSAGTWAGNLCLAATHPELPSDVLTALAGAGTRLSVVSRGSKEMSHNLAVEDFVKLGSASSKLLVLNASVPLTFTPPGVSGVRWTYYTDKTAQRHVNSHAIVNAGIVIGVEQDSGIVVSFKAVFGGLTIPGLFVVGDDHFVGKSVSEQAALETMISSVLSQAHAAGICDDTRNSQAYRASLAASFLYKAVLQAQIPDTLPSRLVTTVADSLACVADRPVSQATQFIDVGDKAVAPVGVAMPKRTAFLQASGEAIYSSDLPAAARELCGAFVLTEAAGEVLALDLTIVKRCPGVKDVVLPRDFPAGVAGNNNAADTSETTPQYLVGVGEMSKCAGARVALVLADTLAHARFAARQAVVSLKKDTHNTTSTTRASEQSFRTAVQRLSDSGFARRAGLNIERLDAVTRDARRSDASGGTETEQRHWALCQGRPEHEWLGDGSSVNLQGTFSVGGQKHFFLETHVAVAHPTEEGKMVVHCGAQSSTLTQIAVATALGVQQHNVDVRCRRVGGAFGGKLMHHIPVAVVAAVAANKHGVSVRVHNDRCEDMAATGGRPSMEASYSLAVLPDGTIPSCKLDLRFDSGCMDGAGAAGDLGMATLWADNCYRHTDFECKGDIYHTARLGNTACRAPGVVQVILLHEYVLELAAEAVGLSPDEVRERNLYQEGDKALFDVTIGKNGFNWNVPDMWAKAKCKWRLAERRAQLSEFNAANRWRKRGLSFMPTKYSMGLGPYKEAVTLRAFADSSVHVTYSGFEIGQGIHTKVTQAVAYGLGCDIENITVGDTSAIESPNTTPTGGSGSSECCVKAALDACKKLMTRMPKESGTWAERCKAADKGGVLMLETGWFAGGDTHAKGAYASQGVACIEIELDVLTGETAILQCDIMMDFGCPLNPAIDLGQLEGGFIMALGLYFSEEVLWTGKSNGCAQLNIGSWEYKIPALADIPLKWNVSLINSPNPSPEAVLRSKASGEPPMALASAAWLAARQAIKAARKDAGNTEPFHLDAPLTVQKIQQACLVDIKQFVLA